LLLCCSVIIVLFYVLIVCTVTLPPGVNPIAVDLSIYLFSDTLSLGFSLIFSDQVSHPYRTTGIIIVLDL